MIHLSALFASSHHRCHWYSSLLVHRTNKICNQRCCHWENVARPHIVGSHHLEREIIAATECSILWPDTWARGGNARRGGRLSRPPAPQPLVSEALEVLN